MVFGFFQLGWAILNTRNYRKLQNMLSLFIMENPNIENKVSAYCGMHNSLPDTFSVDKSLKARHARLKLHCKEISMSDNKNGFARLLAL